MKITTMPDMDGGLAVLSTLLTHTTHTSTPPGTAIPTTTTTTTADTPTPYPSTTTSPAPPPPPPTTTTTTTTENLTTTLYQLLTVPEARGSHDGATSPLDGFAVEVGGGEGGRGPSFNTPLSAPEAALEPVTTPARTGPPVWTNPHADLSALGWILPVTVVCVLAMLGLAFAFYYGVQKLELRMLRWCYRNCGGCCWCCAPGGGGGGGSGGGRVLRGEQYDTLSEDTPGMTAEKRETVRLREFRDRSAMYGVTRTTEEEYSPPSFRDGGLEDDDS